jgi:hypothetical protein
MISQRHSHKRDAEAIRGLPRHGAELDMLAIDPGACGRAWYWRSAHERAWKTPPREIALRRLSRAEELGISYRVHALEILERGVYL